ncbi:MAG: J domain-containing protein [Candidatus Microthrix sp.]|nr:J domain-containing protein [Candidatus Microthrix sp.]
METGHSATERDWYRVLGVDRQAGGDTIRVAYRELAWRLHPDRQQSPAAAGGLSHAEQRVAERRMREVNEAFRVLGEPARRAISLRADTGRLRGCSAESVEHARSGQPVRGAAGGATPNVRAARWSRCRTITATTWWTWPATACTDCCSRAWFRRWWRCFSWGSSCSVRLPAVASRTRRRPPPAACWGTRWSIAPSPTKGASSASPTVPIGAPTGRGWSGWLSSTASSRNRPVATVVPTLAW